MIISNKFKNSSLKHIKKLFFIIKKIKILSLLILLQGNYDACTGGRSQNPSIINLSEEKFHRRLDKIDDVSDWSAQEGRSLLYDAVKNKKSKKVKMILKRYHNQKISRFAHKKEDFMNRADPSTGHTPLGESIIQGDIQTFKILVGNEYVDCNKTTGNKHPLIVALGHKNKEVAEKMAEILLYKSNIDITGKDPDTGNTVLHCVIKKKCNDIILKRVIHLMQEKAPHLLTARNKHGNTPLHYLVEFISIDYADRSSCVIGSHEDITSATVRAITKSKANWEENCQGEVPEDIVYKKFVNHPATSLLSSIFPRFVRRVLDNKYTCRCRICDEVRKSSIEDFTSHALNNHYHYKQFDDKSLTARCDKTGRTLLHEFAYIGHSGARNLFTIILKRIDELGAKKKLVKLLFQKMQVVNLNRSDKAFPQELTGWECIYLSNGRDGTTNAFLADLRIKTFYTVASNIKVLESTLDFLKDHLTIDHADRILHTIDDNQRNGLFDGKKGKDYATELKKRIRSKLYPSVADAA